MNAERAFKDSEEEVNMVTVTCHHAKRGTRCVDFPVQWYSLVHKCQGSRWNQREGGDASLASLYSFLRSPCIAI